MYRFAVDLLTNQLGYDERALRVGNEHEPAALFLVLKIILPRFSFFFLMDPAPPEIYPLPLHAALPICAVARDQGRGGPPPRRRARGEGDAGGGQARRRRRDSRAPHRAEDAPREASRSLPGFAHRRAAGNGRDTDRAQGYQGLGGRRSLRGDRPAVRNEGLPGPLGLQRPIRATSFGSIVRRADNSGTLFSSSAPRSFLLWMRSEIGFFPVGSRVSFATACPCAE